MRAAGSHFSCGLSYVDQNNLMIVAGSSGGASSYTYLLTVTSAGATTVISVRSSPLPVSPLLAPCFTRTLSSSR